MYRTCVSFFLFVVVALRICVARHVRVDQSVTTQATRQEQQQQQKSVAEGHHSASKFVTKEPLSLSRDDESARTLGMLDVDGWKQQLNKSYTHARWQI